jgi:predicted transcriptional regulator of viral defense system
MAIKNLNYTAAGTELVRNLSLAGQRIFTTADARMVAPSVGLSKGYLNEALHYLAKSGWIVRLKKGLYALSGSVPGTTPLHEFEIAMALVRPAAISHWSALSYHGLTEQIPRRVFVLTTARSVPRIRKVKPSNVKEGYPIGQTVYQFVQTKTERYFGIEDVWVGDSKIKITDPERTLLDGLLAPRYFGDFAEVLHAFDLRAPKMDLDRIIEYALKLDNATAKRLGWILQRLGIEANRLNPLRNAQIKGYRVLDPSGPRHGSYDSTWMVQVNLTPEVVQ